MSVYVPHYETPAVTLLRKVDAILRARALENAPALVLDIWYDGGEDPRRCAATPLAPEDARPWYDGGPQERVKKHKTIYPLGVDEAIRQHVESCP